MRAKKQRLAISFLIDNSGSMRGSKILGASAWVSIIANILSQANIPNEVLGFTTRAWKGGQSRDMWLADGKPSELSRLNDLRYVIYKSFDQTFQEADTNLV
jgi:cobaltochelatase CobT